MENKNLIIGFIVLIVLAVAAYFGFKEYKRRQLINDLKNTDFNNQEKENNNKTDQETKPKTVSVSYSVEKFPIQKGMKGTLVANIQTALGIKSDGLFGNDTQAALLAKGYPAIVDETTYNKIIGKKTANTGTNAVNSIVKEGVSSLKSIGGSVANVVTEAASWTPVGLLARAAGVNKDNLKTKITGLFKYSDYCNYV